MSNAAPVPPLPPLGDDERPADPTVTEDDVTTEVDGERKLDPDANDDLIDSAEADRIAAEEGGGS